MTLFSFSRYNPDEREYQGKQHRAEQAALATATTTATPALTTTTKAPAKNVHPAGYYNAQTTLQVMISKVSLFSTITCASKPV